jgi:hypothetical protein
MKHLHSEIFQFVVIQQLTSYSYSTLELSSLISLNTFNVLSLVGSLFARLETKSAWLESWKMKCTGKL